jgi:thioredoxin 1
MPDKEIYDVTEQDFDEKVIEASRNFPVLVDFWAGWCAPCIALTPVLEKLARENKPRFRLAKVEVDENMHLAGRYQLKGFPTVILFSGGQEKGRFSSMRSAQWIDQFISEYLVD